MTEVVKDLCEKYKFVEINIDNADKSIPEKYGIRGIPAILFFNKGSQVGEAVIREVLGGQLISEHPVDGAEDK
jgi:thioredoxin 1